MVFLEKILDHLLFDSQDLSEYALVLPGKRPIVFIKRIIENKGYEGFLPEFITIEELCTQLSDSIPIEGVALWLFAYHEYQKSTVYNGEDFASFLKWYPTLQKDSDDMLKYEQDDHKVLEYLYDEERIKNWAENLGDISPDSPRKKYLNFWKNAHQFLPQLKNALKEKNWATPGMLHELARKNISSFVQKTQKKWVFCGFNALTPLEEELIKALLQADKAQAFFHTDAYYMNNPLQEAGTFLRKIKKWKEFNEYRPFAWVENEFSERKNINIIECPGNIAQTQYLRNYLTEHTHEEETAIVLMDENLLPATLDAVSSAKAVNITMGYPLKNLSFNNAVKSVFHLQKQLEKKSSSYYYNDVLPIIEGWSFSTKEIEKMHQFKTELEKRNMVYIRPDFLQEHLKDMPYFPLLAPTSSETELIENLLEFCKIAKNNNEDDAILFENISVFEKVLTTLLNLITTINFPIQIEALEQLISQLLNSEMLSFEGEPLQGLQVMGLLETRLLNFKNIILLSVNEGKIPTPASQNSFIPFDVRRHFNLYTYQEYDAIFAYHFYRLLQGAENVVLLYNGLSSGLNTGEKSRFITQLEYEANTIHSINKKLVDLSSTHLEQRAISVEKTPIVMEKLNDWKKNVSASSLTSYVYDPYQFYLSKILGARETTEISEELSTRDYGTLIHSVLEILYTPICGKYLTDKDLTFSQQEIDDAILQAIEKLKHELEFYQRGINFIHKTLAEKIVKAIIYHDLQLVKKGHQLKIIALEKEFSDVYFPINEDQTDAVYFHGIIDRIDELDGTLRVIDYKSAKVSSKLHLDIKPDKIETHFMEESNKQAMQLAIYLHALPSIIEYKYSEVEAGIWSFASVKKGVTTMQYDSYSLQDALQSLRFLIHDILNPEKPFEAKPRTWNGG